MGTLPPIRIQISVSEAREMKVRKKNRKIGTIAHSMELPNIKTVLNRIPNCIRMIQTHLTAENGDRCLMKRLRILFHSYSTKNLFLLWMHDNEICNLMTIHKLFERGSRYTLREDTIRYLFRSVCHRIQHFLSYRSRDGFLRLEYHVSKKVKTCPQLAHISWKRIFANMSHVTGNKEKRGNYFPIPNR